MLKIDKMLPIVYDEFLSTVSYRIRHGLGITRNSKNFATGDYSAIWKKKRWKFRSAKCRSARTREIVMYLRHRRASHLDYGEQS